MLFRTFFVVTLLVVAGPSGIADNKEGRPGDEFRHAAMQYDQQAAEAVQEATHTEGKAIGKHLQLSSIYRQMAAIKRKAAVLADQGQWDDISWDEYHRLEKQRDELLGQIGHGAQKQTTKKQNKSNDHGFLKAARQYEQQADKAREKATKSDGQKKQLYTQLVATLQDMAHIKREAAAANQAGKKYNWDAYHRLSQRRDKLKHQIKKAH